MQGVYAERAFAPWIDMEKKMRQENIPLFSLETFTALSDFDVIMFTLQYEMHYTTILNLIDLGGIEVFTKDRKELPIVLGGGPSAYNPEPLADFFDGFLIGDGEKAVQEIVQTVSNAKKRHLNREQILKELMDITGMYIPSFYTALYSAEGEYKGLRTQKDAPQKIKSRICDKLDIKYYPEKLLVPIISIAHDRISIEIARGCTRGCRFCNAGMIYRPVRERSVEDILFQASKNLQYTGYNEIALVSLSTSDYSQMDKLLEKMNPFTKRMVNISFPSLRPEKFTPEIAQFAKKVRKSGLTLAPEAGTQRLRNIINKGTTTHDLLRAVDLAFREGWKLVKLYFMIGQPGETMEDVEGIASLIKKISNLAKLHGNKNIHVSISPFIAKPHTPFQWAGQDSLDEIEKKLNFLKNTIRFRNTKLSWRDSKIALIEAVLARGDRKVARLLHTVWRHGARLEGWSEHFNYDLWTDAFSQHGMRIQNYTHEIDRTHVLPWSHIDKGVTVKFLQDEYKRAIGEEITVDCKTDHCNKCGLMARPICKQIQKGEGFPKLITTSTDNRNEEEPKPVSLPDKQKIFRIHYQRDENVRFYSHLDMIRMFERAFRRANLKIVYTEGYNPHPKISYGLPLSTGYLSKAEYMDVFSYCQNKDDLRNELSKQLPLGIDILNVKTIYKSESIQKMVNRVDYYIKPVQYDRESLQKIIYGLLDQEQIIIHRKNKKKLTQMNIRPFILDIETTADGFTVCFRIKNGKTARVDELLSLLFPKEKELADKAVITRTGLYIQHGDLIVTPMSIQVHK
jgi:radical SAM family uncharacterized protein/radical SAM-linked protein